MCLTSGCWCFLTEADREVNLQCQSWQGMTHVHLYHKWQKLVNGLHAKPVVLRVLQTFNNPLTTKDDYRRHQNSATCCQLTQSVLKIGSALAERVGQGEVGGCTALGDSAWRLLQLAIEKPWSVLDGPFFCFLVQMSVENSPSAL